MISTSATLEEVEHTLTSGSGTLGFAVAGENVKEDCIMIKPAGDFFVCEIEADGEKQNTGPAQCVSE